MISFIYLILEVDRKDDGFLSLCLVGLKPGEDRQILDRVMDTHLSIRLILTWDRFSSQVVLGVCFTLWPIHMTSTLGLLAMKLGCGLLADS
jgi:hypothetical protein